MKPGRGKEKGGAFEREIAVELSLWLTGGQSKDVLVRSEGSGARFTATKNVGTPGDLMPKHPVAFEFCDQFVVECKHWKDLEFMKFLQGKGELMDALIKVRGEAQGQGKNWMLIARQNNRPTCLFIGIPQPIGVIPQEVAIERVLWRVPITKHFLFAHEVFYCNLKDFIKEVAPVLLLERKASGANTAS